MNKIVLIGNLVKDPELKFLEQTDKMYTKFVIAVERNFKSADGTRKADFIRVSMWGKRAEVACRYLTKGSLISVSGRLRTGSYEDKDGTRRYTAEVVAEDFKIVNTRKSEYTNSQ